VGRSTMKPNSKTPRRPIEREYLVTPRLPGSAAKGRLFGRLAPMPKSRRCGKGCTEGNKLDLPGRLAGLQTGEPSGRDRRGS
jgi:hypothetical protein